MLYDDAGNENRWVGARSPEELATLIYWIEEQMEQVHERPMQADFILPAFGIQATREHMLVMLHFMRVVARYCAGSPPSIGSLADDHYQNMMVRVNQITRMLQDERNYFEVPDDEDFE